MGKLRHHEISNLPQWKQLINIVTIQIQAVWLQRQYYYDNIMLPLSSVTWRKKILVKIYTAVFGH